MINMPFEETSHWGAQTFSNPTIASMRDLMQKLVLEIWMDVHEGKQHSHSDPQKLNPVNLL